MTSLFLNGFLRLAFSKAVRIRQTEFISAVLSKCLLSFHIAEFGLEVGLVRLSLDHILSIFAAERLIDLRMSADLAGA